MRSRKEILGIEPNLEGILISNFVRLCINDGIESKSAYKELELRLEALNELKSDRKR